MVGFIDGRKALLVGVSLPLVIAVCCVEGAGLDVDETEGFVSPSGEVSRGTRDDQAIAQWLPPTPHLSSTYIIE